MRYHLKSGHSFLQASRLLQQISTLIDDLHEQPTWSTDEAKNLRRLYEYLYELEKFVGRQDLLLQMGWVTWFTYTLRWITNEVAQPFIKDPTNRKPVIFLFQGIRGERPHWSEFETVLTGERLGCQRLQCLLDLMLILDQIDRAAPEPFLADLLPDVADLIHGADDENLVAGLRHYFVSRSSAGSSV